ncbi:MAG: carbon storage regulator CsrA [Chloroflexi bacterium]|jgi:carbon storage regulator|nr:carbon storage regulator CsrA [Chloroflexota bacterium]
MLVLSRRPGESILIGDNIAIVVIDTDGGQVRLGVQAPRDVPVLRSELLAQVEAENRRALVRPAPPVLAVAQAQVAGRGGPRRSSTANTPQPRDR